MSRSKNPRHDHVSGARKREATQKCRQMVAMRRFRELYGEALRLGMPDAIWEFLALGREPEFDGRTYKIPLPTKDRR